MKNLTHTAYWLAARPQIVQVALFVLLTVTALLSGWLAPEAVYACPGDAGSAGGC